MRLSHRLLYCFIISLFVLSGCARSSSPSSFSTSLYSDSTLDGDIEKTSSTSFVVTQGMSPSVQSVYAGIDPASGTETRAFLFFALDSVPADAIIDSAYLDLHIDSITADASKVPFRIDLMDGSYTNLAPADYDSTAVSYISISPPISISESKTTISLDVTDLVDTAFANGYGILQLRMLEDYGTNISGLIEFNDSTDPVLIDLVPYLTILYH